MIAVIFEVMPSADGRAEYLERAAQLGPVLASPAAALVPSKPAGAS